MRTISIILGVAGMCLVANYSPWEVALGMFLMIWANNID